MANYDEPLPTTSAPEPLAKRVRYFDTQFLQDQDFIDDQMFHIVQLHREARLLRVAGIARGLDVQANGTLVPPTATAFTVTAGAAIDVNGRQVVLSTNTPGPSLPTTLTATTQMPVYIQFFEGATDPPPPGSPTRWTIDPNILLAPNPVPGDAIYLATLTVDVTGHITAITTGAARQYTGIALPGPTNAPGLSLRASGDQNLGLADFAGNLRLQSGNLTTASLNVTGDSQLATMTASGLAKLQGGATVTGTLNAGRLTSTTAAINSATWGGQLDVLGESRFGYSSYADPQPNVTRDAKFGQNGIAVAGGALIGGGLTVTSDELHVTSSSNQSGRFQVYNNNGNLGYRVRTDLGGGWRWQFVDAGNAEYFGVDYPSGDVQVKRHLRVIAGLSTTNLPPAFDTNYPTGHMTLRSPGYLFLTGANTVHVTGNAFYDGTYWNRYDTTQPACFWSLSQGNAYYATAAAATNPISAFATRMFIGSNGRVGIGTTSPNSTLHVVTDEISITTASNTGSRFQVYESGGGNLGYRVRTSGGGGWRWQFVEGGNGEYFAVDYPDGNAITKGHVYVGGSEIHGGARYSTNFRLALQGDRNMCLYDNTSGGALWCSNTYISDVRIKRDIVDMGGVMDRMNRVRAVRFRYNNGLDDGEEHLGLIAQEVEAEFPDLVYTDPNGYKLVRYDKLSSVLWQAVKELNARVSALETHNGD